MAAASPTGLDAVAYAREVVALGAGEILLTSMDRDGTKSGFDLALDEAPCPRPLPFPSSRRGASAPSITSSKACGTVGRPPSSPPRSSISATFTIGQAKRRMAEAGVPMRLDGLAPNQEPAPGAGAGAAA